MSMRVLHGGVSQPTRLQYQAQLAAGSEKQQDRQGSCEVHILIKHRSKRRVQLGKSDHAARKTGFTCMSASALVMLAVPLNATTMVPSPHATTHFVSRRRAQNT